MNTHDEDFMLRTYDHDSKRIVPIHFHGQRLAHASSQRPQHTHPTRHWAIPHERCSACRWFEAGIYVVTESAALRDQPVGAYVLETSGKTIVPNERDRFRVRVFVDPWVVVAKLMKRHDNDVYLPPVSKNVLEQAARKDKKIAEALSLIDCNDHLLLNDLRGSHVHHVDGVEDDDEITDDEAYEEYENGYQTN